MYGFRVASYAPILLIAAAWLTGCIVPPGLRGNVETGEVDVASWHDVQDPLPEAWHYVDVDGPVCANGKPVGLGLNPGTDPDQLVIYLNGGGACWSSATCHFLRTAANVDVEYGAERMAEELFPLKQAGLLNRRAEVNPWPRAHFAYVPYCTGDLFMGSRVSHYHSSFTRRPFHHTGATNLYHYLSFLGQQYPNARQVWLVGTSAGGYGIIWNLESFKAAFPAAEIHVFADASPWLEVDRAWWAGLARAWGIAAPEGCESCLGEPEALLPLVLNDNPDIRFAMSMFREDRILGNFLGIRTSRLRRHIDDFIEMRFQGSNTDAFVTDGSDHEVLLELGSALADPNGESFSTFFRRWALGDVEQRPSSLRQAEPELNIGVEQDTPLD
jgi:hypothetical protein